MSTPPTTPSRNSSANPPAASSSQGAGPETAIILAGAVAKGAFEAGVLDVLSRQKLGLRRLVSASVGSLNALVYAAGLRAGREAEVAEGLLDLWRTRAEWQKVFDPSPSELLRGRALSGTGKVEALLKEQLDRWLPPQPGAGQPVELRMVVTLTDGTLEPLGPDRATTYEHVFVFANEDFDIPEKRDLMVDVAVASAAFPLAFAPKQIPGFGLGYDGGLVANTPVKEAIEGSWVQRIFVVDPQPAQVVGSGLLAGTQLLSHLGEILVRERLFRDLSDAYRGNDALAGLESLVQKGVITAEQRTAVMTALSWQERRTLEILPVRSAEPLPGNPFSGFFRRSLREHYIDAGRQAAEATLAQMAPAPVK